jgi:nucleoid DNA-binding protein
MLRKRFRTNIIKCIDYLGADSNEIMKILTDILLNLFKNSEKHIIGRNSISVMEIRKFGSFRLKRTEERISRNPKSGEKIITGSKIKVIFRASEKILERINE